MTRSHLAAVTILAALAATAARAQNPNQFGGQDRADAASEMIVLAVQQAISSLPPTSGQSFAYTYDPETLSFVASEQLGPTAFVSTYTVGKGKFAFRGAASYFDLSESFGPITYLVEGPSPGYTKFGTDASARVALFNLSGSFGLTPRIELSLNLPITVVDAHASQTYTTLAAEMDLPTPDVFVANSQMNLDLLLRGGRLAIVERSFDALGFQFNSGTQAGVGRIGLGGKGVVWTHERARVALAPQLFLPSPSQDEFAGPDSVAIYPRAVAQVRATDFLQFLVDVGYDYDFDSSALRRFAWNLGATVPGSWYSVDAGFGGSQYDSGIRWTPSVATGSGSTGREFTLTALENNQLGTTFVDFVGGLKFRLAEQVVASGAVTVPITADGFRPDALGTLAVELLF